MTKEKRLETEVVLCEGKTDIFKEVLFSFADAAATALPFFIEDVNVKLQNVVLDVVDGKCCDAIIFSAELFVNVIYKTRGDIAADGTVTGTVNHRTTVVPISGCIPVNCEKIKKCDKNVKAKLIDVCIAESHVLRNILAGDATSAFPRYRTIAEQVCIKIKAKVVTDEIVTLKFEDEDDKDRKCKW